MNKYILFFVAALFAFSCKKENETEQKVAAVPVANVKVERFDKMFYESKPEELASLKKKYPYFFPAGTPDTVWTNKINSSLLQELHSEVEKKFPATDELGRDLQVLFQHIKFYFSGFKEPRVVTLISEMDYENKTIYTDSLALISLDLYLGKGHKFYEFPEYLKQGFEPKQILPDMVSSFAATKIPPPRDRSLLGLMIYYGKELYLKDLLLPDYSDADKMGYTPEQIKFVEENQAEMWTYFIENNLLFDNDSKLPGRFINPAPFSKFYLEIDKETPGRAGQWVGWQIVRSYMDNNKEVTLQKMLEMDAKTIFDNSKYKPKK